MATIEIFNSDKEELENAIKAVENIGGCTDATCLIEALMFYLPKVIEEDYGICLEDYERMKLNAE